MDPLRVVASNLTLQRMLIKSYNEIAGISLGYRKSLKQQGIPDNQIEEMLNKINAKALKISQEAFQNYIKIEEDK